VASGIKTKKRSRGLLEPKPRRKHRTHLSITPVVVHESRFDKLNTMIASLPPNIQDRLRRASAQYLN